MSQLVSLESPQPEISLLVCESGRRWCDTARRFVGPFQHAPDQLSTERLFAVQPIEHEKIHAMIAGLVSVAILWEISTENISSRGLTIAQIGVGRPHVFQIVAIQDESAAESHDLSLRIMELGIAAVVQAPEQFPVIARLLRRRFASVMPHVS